MGQQQAISILSERGRRLVVRPNLAECYFTVQRLHCTEADDAFKLSHEEVAAEVTGKDFLRVSCSRGPMSFPRRI